MTLAAALRAGQDFQAPTSLLLRERWERMKERRQHLEILE